MRDGEAAQGRLVFKFDAECDAIFKFLKSVQRSQFANIA